MLSQTEALHDFHGVSGQVGPACKALDTSLVFGTLNLVILNWKFMNSYCYCGPLEETLPQEGPS